MKDGRLGAPIGRRPVGQGWRIFLWLAAAYNLVIGALGLFSPTGHVDARIVGLMLVAFGLVFALAARDPERFAPILWAGAIAKLGTAALLAPKAIAPDATLLVSVATVLEALFAVGFLTFMLSRRGTA